MLINQDTPNFSRKLYSQFVLDPGTCQVFLQNYCSKYTRDEISKSPALVNFCGCYAPPLQGDVARYFSTPTGQYLHECDPRCSRASTVQLDTLGEPNRCNVNICGIDSVSIDLARPHLQFIDFTQVCLCPPGQCRCILNGPDPSELIGRLGLNASFKQICGPDSVCLKTAANGINEVVPCNVEPIKFRIWGTFYIVLVVIVIIIIIVAIIYYIFKKTI